jgi:hypothetical protein
LLALVTQQSGDAAANAKRAQDTADAIEKKANELGIRLGETSRQVEAQGPRYVVLEHFAADLEKKLSPFPKQMVLVQACGTFASDPTFREEVRTVGSIESVLNKAGWYMPPHHPNSWDQCTDLGWIGIYVFVNEAASGKTRKAAEVLGGELTSDLPPQGQNQKVLMPVAKLDPKKSALVRPEWDLPRFEVSRYPDMIVVLVGSQPFPQGTRPSSAKSATQK